MDLSLLSNVWSHILWTKYVTLADNGINKLITTQTVKEHKNVRIEQSNTEHFTNTTDKNQQVSFKRNTFMTEYLTIKYNKGAVMQYGCVLKSPNTT